MHGPHGAAGGGTTLETCPGGELIGIERDGVQVFAGIRYATAERFEPPIDVEVWSGVLDATGPGPQAPQRGGVLERLLGTDDLPTSEDCLVLDVVTPACDGARRPVLVWIHGGAFLTGSGSMPWYDGASLARRGDVVVVTVNYRLGALGFLGGRNSGLLDQVAALRWVQRNIAAFGGDPDAVTVFGESAGGAAVVALAAMPSADGLFHRSYASSPSLLQFRSSDQGDRSEATFLDLLGCRTVDEARTRPVEEILDAQTRFPDTSAGLRNFSPTEGAPAIPRPILDTAASDPRPLIVGTNRDEMLLFTAFDPSRAEWTDDDVRREFATRFGEHTDRAIEQYRVHRPDASPSALVSAMQTDEMFRRPAQQLAERRVAAGSPTWVYEFHHRSPMFGGVIGACHGLEIPYVFHNLDRRGVDTFAGSGTDHHVVADLMSAMVIDFAHNGDPGWAEFDLRRRPTRRLGPEPALLDDPEPTLRSIWSRR